MNVIIRLQNLSWSACATDIRNFFKNLMIPEGGVHIIGGENGDAFIAFR
jgi:RNA-binding protein 12